MLGFGLFLNQLRSQINPAVFGTRSTVDPRARSVFVKIAKQSSAVADGTSVKSCIGVVRKNENQLGML
jgi:hypothetical protein